MTRFCFLITFALIFSTNCFSKTSLISNQDPLLLTLVSLQNPNCFDPQGSITVLATGGNLGYTYDWNTGASGPVLTGISTGDYTVIVTDGDGSTADLTISVLADFTAPAANAGTPAVVPCTNTITSLNGSGSTGPDFSYQWAASNGGHVLSGGNTLTPVIDHAGTFQLTVSDLTNGCTATDITTVTAQNITPAATATGGAINCASNTVTLSVVYTTLHTTFGWQGPGGFNSQLLNPVVSVVGNYVFTVTDTLTGCINKSTAVVNSNFVAPNVDASGGGIITCAQTSVQLTGASTTPGATFHWTGPNGYSSDLQNPLVNSAGTYTLTVQNPVNGCKATDAVTVTSNLTAPTAFASVGGTLTCVVQMVQLTGSSNTPGVSFDWAGPNNFTSSLQSINISVPGPYTLTVKNPVNGCTGTVTVTVLQNIATPNASASGGVKTCSSPTVSLAGNSSTQGVTYSWTGPGGFMSTLQNPSVSFVGNYTLKVTSSQNGCTATVVAVVSQNIAAPSVSATSGIITCNNPQAQITTTASPQGLSFSWTGPNNFSSSQKNPLVGVTGYYTVTATNPANGCTNSASVYVSENTTPPFAYTGEDKSLNCYFTSILINASFSSNGANFSYLWTTWDGHIVSGANTLYPRVDLEGNYTLKVTNTQNGCIDLDSMVVTQSTPVTAVISQTTPVYCSGGSNGTATVSGGGGSQSYSYNWSNGQQTATITGLSAGVYTVTVTDSESCSATASTTVNQLVVTAFVNVIHQSIPAVNNGSATVIGGGGTAPYTFKWSNGATTFAINNLAPGPYTVTLTDAHGCTIVKTTNVNPANCIITGTISGVNVTCSGANNGTATVTLNSAINPIIYSWSNGGTAKTITGLAPGTYSVTATDASSCQVVQTVQITSPQPLLASVTSKTDVRCPSAADGSLSVGVTGGVQPYAYFWSNNASSSAISNLAQGNYTLTVTDAKNCTSTLSAQINGPSPITISILNKADVNCPGANTGAVSVSVLGGLPPYHYFWSNGGTTAAISGLTPGNYTLTITDANDCPKSLSAQISVLDQAAPVLFLKNATLDLDNNGTVTFSPTLFDNGSFDDCGIASWTVTPNTFNCNQIGANMVTITATDPSGHTSTGTAILTVEDDIVPSVVCPANITTGSCNPVVQFNVPQVIDNCQFNPAQLVQLNGLPSGSTFPPRNTLQTFQYTDQAGNVGQCSFEVYVEEAVTFATTSIPATCSGNCDGAVSLAQLSGGNFSIAWNNGQTGLNLSGLCPGIFTATITDTYNCVHTKTTSVIVSDLQMPTLVCPGNLVGSYCSGPVTYTMPFVIDNCTVIPANLQLIAGLPSGSMFPIGNTQQTFSYTDGGGNNGQCSFSVNITGPSTQNTVIQSVTCANLCNGSAQLTVSGGSGPFNIHWSNGQNGALATNLCAGNYTYTVSDFSGCMQSGSISVSQPLQLMLSVDQVLNDHGNTGVGSIQISPSGGIAPYTFNWTRNGQFYATTKNLNNISQGQYIVVITDANGCTSSSGMITVSNTVGTKTPEWTQALTLSPNPASESVMIDFAAPLGQAAELRLCNVNGQLVSTQRIEATAQHVFLDVSALPAGLWLVQLSLEDGQRTMRKVVVER
ncbi:MAG: HYR domain-containing protein [Phycisphaerae bacterium]|nr:HYR domain-containing protein [Saprospiraceae bacterium]